MEAFWLDAAYLIKGLSIYRDIENTTGWSVEIKRTEDLLLCITKPILLGLLASPPHIMIILSPELGGSEMIQKLFMLISLTVE